MGWAVPKVTLEATADFQRRCGADPLCYPFRGGDAGNGLGWLSDIPALGFPYGGFKNNRIHAYIAEGWRPTPRLQMNFGVRWVYEPGANLPDLVKPALLDEFQPGMSGPVKQDTNNFAPQIGLAWDPTGGGKWGVRTSAGLYYDNLLLRNNWWIRNNLTRAAITNATSSFGKITDPNTNKTIFALDGSDPSAMITPGVNWLSGPQCIDPRLPPGNCALGTPGLLDAILQAAAEYRAASQRLAQGTSKESNCERNRTCQLMDPNYRTPYTLQFTARVQRELRPGLVLSVDYVRHRGQRFPMRTEMNRLGAADTLDVAKATAAIVATNKSLGCGASASAAAGRRQSDGAARARWAGLPRFADHDRHAYFPPIHVAARAHYDRTGVGSFQYLQHGENAVDAMPEGGKIQARVSGGHEWSGQRRQGIRVTIADNGSGMPPEVLSRIFQRGFTTKSAGHGIGLSVVNGIVQKHRGVLHVRSSTQPSRHGTVFALFLPAG